MDLPPSDDFDFNLDFYLDDVGISYTEEELRFVESCINDEPMQAPTPLQAAVLPPPEPFVDTTEKQPSAPIEAPGKVYLEQEFLESLVLPSMAAPSTTEIHDDVALAATLPPSPLPPVVLPAATPLTAPDSGRRPQRKKVNRWSKEEHE